MRTDDFRNLPVLVTGHTGFKGSWLAIWLDLLGARVSGFSLDPPTTPSNYEASGVGEILVHDLRGDVRDAEAVRAAVRLVQPAVIFHLAAQPLVRRSYESPAYTFDVNVMGTVQVLEAVRTERHACVVVVVTSDKCYENNEQVWGFRECDPLGGGDPYSASKGATEIAVTSWRHSYFDPSRLSEHGVKLASVRAGNVIGGGDWAEDRVVPDLVRALGSGTQLVLRNPDAVRPWQHVLEPLSGYLDLAARMLREDDERLCSAWNFGPLPQSTVTVRTLVELLIDAWGRGEWHDGSEGKHVKEAHVLRLSIDKATGLLGWSPKWDIGRTALQTASWYRAALEPGANMMKKCHEEIEAYMGSAGFPGRG